MSRRGRLFAVTAVLTHAVGAIVGGSFNPGDWPAIVVLGCIFFLAPCIGLGVAVLEGMFESEPLFGPQQGRF